MDGPLPAYEGDQSYIFVSYAHEDAAIVYPEIRRLQEENELLGNLIRRTVQKHSEVPRFHSLVKVETTTLKVVDEE